jgi:hypothetical protein
MSVSLVARLIVAVRRPDAPAAFGVRPGVFAMTLRPRAIGSAFRIEGLT